MIDFGTEISEGLPTLNGLNSLEREVLTEFLGVVEESQKLTPNVSTSNRLYVLQEEAQGLVSPKVVEFMLGVADDYAVIQAEYKSSPQIYRLQNEYGC